MSRRNTILITTIAAISIGALGSGATVGFVGLIATQVVIEASAQEILLPLGDGKISSDPELGSVYSCQTQFGGAGAFRDGDWIQGNWWDPNGIPVVDGEVLWPNSEISVSVSDDLRLIRANNLPSHPTGIYPIGAQDDAYQYDRNPNSISAQSIVLDLPAVPTIAASPTCLPMGMIGFSLTGVAIFNALDGMGRDAPAHEILDACGGHPERTGQYHYHGLSVCIEDPGAMAERHSELVGFALDGFGIFGPAGEDGVWLTTQNLDACHGHTHSINWNGTGRDIFHYHLTRDYPYTLGCFRGTPVAQMEQQAPTLGSRGGGRPGGRPPPPRR